MINVITLIVCYCKGKGKGDQSNVNLYDFNHNDKLYYRFTRARTIIS